MKTKLFKIAALLKLVIVFSCLTYAQTAENKSPAPADDADADIVILANIKARELTIEAVPNTKVDFFGTHERQTIWEDERQNLPRPVQPGVTYRNIGIQLRIVSRFADIERIVAEALGEIPISDKADNSQAQPNTSNNVPESNQKLNLNSAPPQKPK